MNFQIVVLYVMTPCSDVVGYHPEDGGTMVLRNGDMLHHYKVSQHRKPKPEINIFLWNMK
jgi:hypothetical protein